MNQFACRAYNTGHGESDTKMAIQSHIGMAMSEDNALCWLHKISLSEQTGFEIGRLEATFA